MEDKKKSHGIAYFAQRWLVNKVYIVLAIVLLAALVLWGIRLLLKGNSLSFADNSNIDLTPTQVEHIEAIGEWEFLQVNDEELIDTIKHGFFGDSELARIYYGTLRLGINLKETPEGWLTQKHDTLIATLPPIKLLDLHFIDEARTMSFYEKGSWTETDRKHMYEKAYNVMLKRALSRQNLQLAQENAQQQVKELLRSMGAKNVVVVFSHTRP
ncbi:DUF4230 domain-containing protein [Prevotella sp. HJM029]|uniref:DUF4230 domain-containing protein n=1 Tax=Prevotella sp. HJM029 TaxID=1433844 RepID=UPI00048B7F57|nr:DUF4230 domain-containing protein [Prevotella sp. HJM029]